MKKFLLIAALLCGITLSAFAAPGDVTGKIYSTDILAYVNDKPIQSYNIGGRTCVIVEDFYQYGAFLDSVSYGIDWEYNDADRLLAAYSNGDDGYGEVSVERGNVGKVTGNIYETDIKVIFNGKEVMGYNIGGRTAVCIEELGTVLENGINTDYGYSDYLCNFVWDADKREVRLYTYQSENKEFHEYIPPKTEVIFNDNVMSCHFDQMNRFDTVISHNFSDAFSNDTNKIKPVIYNGEEVGTMCLTSNGHCFKQLDRHKIYRMTKDIAYVMPYQETAEYINGNFEISDTYENDYAKYYLAKQGDMHYLLISIKPEGFVAWPLSEGYVFKDDIKSGKKYLSAYTGGPPGTGMVEIRDFFTDWSFGFYDWKSAYEETISHLYDEYNVSHTAENDEYFAMLDREGRTLVCVNRDGEYAVIDEIGMYDEDSTLTLTLTETAVNINIYPFAGMRDANSMDLPTLLSVMEFTKTD